MLCALYINAQVYQQTSNLAVYSMPSGGAFGPVNFQGVPPQPAASGTLTFYYRGDLDSPTGGEFFEVLDENNLVIGQSNSTTQCNANFDSSVFVIQAADLATWAANGTISFSFNAGTGVNGQGLCPQPSGAFVKLSYPFQTGGNFCPGPFGINATNIDTNSLSLGWTSGGSPIANIEFGPAGFSLGTGTQILNVTSNPLSISNLQKGNTYDFYVQDSCLNTNNASFWAGPFRVTIPIAAPYYQGFDNVTVPSLPFGWSQLIHNVSTFSLPSALTSNGNLFNEPTPVSLPNMGRFDIIFGTSTINNDTVFLVSPPVFDLASGLNRIRFSAASPGPQFMQFGILTNPNNKASFIPLDTIGPLTSTFQEFTKNVTSYNGPIARLAFKFYGTANSSDGYIDNIFWEPIPQNEIEVVGFNSPSLPFTLGSQNVAVSVRNNGTDTLFAANIGWQVNGVIQPPFTLNLTGNNRLAVDQTANNIVIGNFNFSNNLNVIKSWTANPNGVPDEIPENDSAVAVFCTGLNGSYTAGSPSADFPQLSMVFEALRSCGLTGPTTIHIAKGTYQLNEEISNITGLGAHPLTFIGDSASNTIITSAGADGRTSTILLDNVENVTFKKLWIQNEAASIGRCIMIRNQCNNITIDSCRMVATNPSLIASLQVVGVYLGPDMQSNFTEGNPGKNITIKNTEFFNLEQALQVEAAAQTPAKNIRFENNFITSGLDGAIRLDNIDSTYIIGNKVEQMAVTNSAGIVAEDLRTFWIHQNEFYIGGGGINMNRCNDTTGLVGEIINNIISAGFAGMDLRFCNSTQIYHNSVVASPTFTVRDFQNSDVRNNIFISAQGFAFSAFNASFIQLDYNIYSTNGSFIASNNGGNITDFAAFQAALPLFNNNALSGDPLFNSPTNFRITYGLLANDHGDSTVNVFTDIDGQVRPASGSTRPDIGADEYTPPAYDLGLNTLLSQRGFCFSDTDTVSFQITNYGLNDLFFATDSFTLFWEITGPTNQSGSQVFNTDSLAAGDTANFVLNTNVDFSQYGTYLLTAYLVSAWDSLAINDSIVERTITVPTLINATGDTIINLPGALVNLDVQSPVLNNVLISEILQFRTGVGQTNPYPTFLPTLDFDMAEIANVSSTTADVSNYSFEMYDQSGLLFSYTVPNNVTVPPYDVLLLGFGSFANQPLNNLYWMNGINTSSNAPNGYIFKDATGTIVDAVATNGFNFPPSSGVNTNDWSGIIPSASGAAGVIRSGADNNVSSDWTVSTVTNVMTIGTFNPNLDSVPPVKLNWFLDTVLVDSVPSFVIGPLYNNGTFNYVASIQTPCGTVFDTVVVEVDIPYSDTGLVDVVVDSLGITDNLLCNATQTQVKMYLTNTGSDTVYFIPAGYSLNNQPSVNEIIIDTLFPGVQKEVQFNSSLSLPSTGIQNINAWVVILGDTISINDTNTFTFQNRPLPNAPVASADTNYCPGSQIQSIFANSASGTITWYNSSLLDSASFLAQADTILPANTSGASSYFAVATDTFGCSSNPTEVIVGVYGFPNANAGGNTSVCFGSTKTIVASGGVSYVWSNGSSSAINQVSPTVPTSYSVTVTDANGCVAADTILVSIDTLPNVSLSSLNSVCLNAPALILTGGLPTGGVYSGNAVNNGQFSPSAAGVGLDTIMYTFTNNKGCANVATQTIQVDSLPNVTFGNLPSICANASPIQLTGGAPAGGFYSGAGVTSGNFNPAQAGGPGNKFLTYTFTDANGCSNSATSIITTLAPPNATLAVFPAICEDYNPFILTGGKPAGGSYSGTGVTNDTIYPSVAGAGLKSITYTVTGTNGCTAAASRNILIDAKPAKPKVFVFGTDSLLADVNAPKYQWYFEGQFYPEVTKVIFAQISGFYQVEAINGTCTSERSDETYFEVLAVESIENNADILVYPNPTFGVLNINNLSKSPIKQVTLFNLEGKEVLSQMFEYHLNEITLNVNNISAGVYILQISDENQQLYRYRIIAE